MSGGYLNGQESFDKTALVTTPPIDDYIHRGWAFMYGLVYEFSDTTPAYFTSYVPLTADAREILLLPINGVCTAGYIIVRRYEDTDFIGGTLQTADNMNREMRGLTHESVIYAGASGDTEDKGTELSCPLLFGTASFGVSVGGGRGAGVNSMVMRKGSKYLYELTPSVACTAVIDAEFVEIPSEI